MIFRAQRVFPQLEFAVEFGGEVSPGFWTPNLSAPHARSSRRHQVGESLQHSAGTSKVGFGRIDMGLELIEEAREQVIAACEFVERHNKPTI